MTFPTEQHIRYACLSYRHDFGLLRAEEQAGMMRSAKEWFHAWQSTMPVPRINAEAIDDEMLRKLDKPGSGIVVVHGLGESRRIQDLLEANNRYLARARAAEKAMGLFGPLGYLVVHPDLSEDEWTLQDDPVTAKDEADGFISVALFAPFADLPTVVVERVVSNAMQSGDRC